MAISTRWRMPPDSSCGYCRARAAGRDAGALERVDGGDRGTAAVGQAVDPQHLGDLVADALHRVQRHRGVLRDRRRSDGRGRPAARRSPRRVRSLPSKRTAPPVTIGGAGQQADDGVRGRRLARSGLADERERLAAAQREVDAAARRRRVPRAVAGSETAQAGDLEEGRLVGHDAPRPASRAREMRLAASTVRGDGEARHRRQPPRLAQEVAAGGHERAPLGRRRLGAVAEEAQRGDGEDRDAELQRGEHEHRTDRVRQHVTQPARATSGRRRRGRPRRTRSGGRAAPRTA